MTDGDGVTRATVRRDTADKILSDSSGEHNTGGSLIVTGLNVNEFDDIFSFTLQVRSVLSTDDNEWKPVTVRVMPQLAIDPPVLAESSNLIIGSKTVSFSTNRSDNEYGWTYQWSDSGAQSGTGRSYTKTIRNNQSGTYHISLSWGPYYSTATLIVRAGNASDIVCSCTSDGISSGRHIFIVEKGTTRQLLFSWAGMKYGIGTKRVQEREMPQTGASMVRLNPAPPETQPPAQGTVVADNGSWVYAVTGNEYTDTSPDTASWTASQTSALNNSSSDSVCSIYVVGLEAVSAVTQNTEIGNGPVTFSAKAHFPAAEIISGTRTFNWTADSNEYFSLAAPDTTANTSTVTTVPEKANVSGEDVSVNVYCTYSVEGATFSYTEVFTVVIPSMAEPELIPCIEDDAPFMGSFSPAPDTDNWLDARLSGSSWRIIEGRTIYLKTSEPVNAVHPVSISTDSAGITVEAIKNTDGMAYFRISANAATAGTTAAAKVNVGYWSGDLSFSLIAQPTLTVSACTLDEVNTNFGLALTEASWPTIKTEDCWQCESGGKIYLKITGTPDLQDFAISGVDSAYMSVTTAGTGTVYVCIDTLWPDSDLGSSKDVTLSFSIPDAAISETVRISKAAVPEPAPVPPAPLLEQEPPSNTTPTEVPAEPSTEPTAGTEAE